MKNVFLITILVVFQLNSFSQNQTDTTKMRGTIDKVSENEYMYQYYDVYEKDTHYKYLESKGYQGGGPSWEGIIYGILKIKNPDVLMKVRFDAEGEGLAIWSSNREPLETIAKLVYEIKNDEELMNKAIVRAKEDGRME